MSTRPVPRSVALAVCALLVGNASLMAHRSLALAADGSFYLVRVLGEDRIFGPDARFLANAVRQGPVLIAAHAGLTDTHRLTLILGLGQLVVPAISWSTAVLLTRSDRVVFAVVSMTAGLCAGATWLFSVSESVLAAPLTVLVAVLLWQPRPWRAAQVALAVAASVILVASYETAALTGALLAAWAGWRASVSESSVDRYGGAAVAVASLASVAVAIAGAQDPTQPPSGQSFLYYLVSFEPWPTYLALAAIWIIVGGWAVSAGAWRRGLVTAGGIAVGVSVLALDATSSSAYESRAAATLASLAIVIFLWLRWWRRQPVAEPSESEPSRGGILLVPVMVVALMLVPGSLAAERWAESLDDFRAQVIRSHGVVLADDVLPGDSREVLFDWTSSSLSLIVRSSADDGILVDRNPSLVPFAPTAARFQLPDEFVWG